MTAYPSRPVVALYCRISYDRNGRAEGVEAQERWGRAYAARHWPNLPIEVFVDNDISAADPNVERPSFNRLRQWVKDGRVAQLWGVEQYRIVRQPVEWFSFADELAAAGVDEVHTDRDGVIRVHDDVAGIKAVLGAGEVRRLKRRLKDKFSDEAARGLAPTVRCFGYKLAKTKEGLRTYEQVPEEADAIRWAAEAFLSGWNDQMLAAEWRRRGLAGAHRVKVRDPDTGMIVLDENGEPVRQTSVVTGGAVRRALTNPAVAGLRSYHGEIVAKGIWEPIISEETRQEILSRIGSVREIRTAEGKVVVVDPATTQVRGRTRRKYLLTGGIAACGVCEAPLAAATRKYHSKHSHPYYFCSKNLGGKGCVGIAAGPLEDYVKERLLEELDRPGFMEAFATDPGGEERGRLTTQLVSLTSKRTDLAAAWASDSLSMEEWQRARSGLDQREQALRAQLAAVPPPPERVDVSALKDPRLRELLILGEWREYVDMFVSRVTVLRATPPFNPINLPARVRIEFKVDAGAESGRAGVHR
jgi:DNA invertase Pin-like site-specific DNA recombinase